MQRDHDATPNELHRALLEYETSDLEAALIEWTQENWPMAARAMVYNKKEASDMVAGVSGVRNDECRLVMEVGARVAISERELLCRAIAAVLPAWIERHYDLTPKADQPKS